MALIHRFLISLFFFQQLFTGSFSMYYEQGAVEEFNFMTNFMKRLDTTEIAEYNSHFALQGALQGCLAEFQEFTRMFKKFSSSIVPTLHPRNQIIRKENYLTIYSAMKCVCTQAGAGVSSIRLSITSMNTRTPPKDNGWVGQLFAGTTGILKLCMDQTWLHCSNYMTSQELNSLKHVHRALDPVHMTVNVKTAKAIILSVRQASALLTRLEYRNPMVVAVIKLLMTFSIKLLEILSSATVLIKDYRFDFMRDYPLKVKYGFYTKFRDYILNDKQRFKGLGVEELIALIDIGEQEWVKIYTGKMPSDLYFMRYVVSDTPFGLFNIKAFQHCYAAVKKAEAEGSALLVKPKMCAPVGKVVEMEDKNVEVKVEEENEEVPEEEEVIRQEIAITGNFEVDRRDIFFGKFIIGQFIWKEYLHPLLEELELTETKDYDWDYILAHTDDQVLTLVKIPNREFLRMCIVYWRERSLIAHPSLDDCTLYLDDDLFRVAPQLGRHFPAIKEMIRKFNEISEEDQKKKESSTPPSFEVFGRPRCLPNARLIMNTFAMIRLSEFLRHKTLYPICEAMNVKTWEKDRFKDTIYNIANCTKLGFTLGQLIIVVNVLPSIRTSFAHPRVRGWEVRNVVETLFRDSPDYEFLKSLYHRD